MEQKLQELQALGLDTDTGIMFTGSPEKYIPAIARYVRSCEDNISGIREHLASGQSILNSQSAEYFYQL